MAGHQTTFNLISNLPDQTFVSSPKLTGQSFDPIEIKCVPKKPCKKLLVMFSKLHYTNLRYTQACKALVTSSLIRHTHGKFVTLWVNSIDIRQFHP